MPAEAVARRRKFRNRETWNFRRPFAYVSVDFSAKDELQNIVLLLLTKKRLTPEELDSIFRKEWVPEKWNLLSVVLQSLFEEHADVPAILQHVQSLGCLEWKSVP